MQSRSAARSVWTGLICVALLIGMTGTAFAQDSSVLIPPDTPVGPFSQNKQNEPAIAVDQGPGRNNILAAGSNDERDLEACNAAEDNTCPFTPGVGVSGIYFSFDSGHTWTQPTYRGLSARNCQGAPGDGDPPCDPQEGGPIGTVPNYFENDLVADGDPALAFGPQPTPGGGFSFANGSRLYYASLASALEGAKPFKGAEAITVSHTDNPQSAAAGNNAAWSDPVIASRQGGAQFSDKEQIW